ncbi:hypothetical protein EYF80_047830 [Liparis tanakae]|uniref:Uncharacterized protein n=1 Tax=Liparis tanakae TaxID=230148 RepID=A0A4Z2FL65_9TELE|nr:hypothetical protein EYF80_047830 [Liparis tanakae]
MKALSCGRDVDCFTSSEASVQRLVFPGFNLQMLSLRFNSIDLLTPHKYFQVGPLWSRPADLLQLHRDLNPKQTVI